MLYMWAVVGYRPHVAYDVVLFTSQLVHVGSKATFSQCRGIVHTAGCHLRLRGHFGKDQLKKAGKGKRLMTNARGTKTRGERLRRSAARPLKCGRRLTLQQPSCCLRAVGKIKIARCLV
jgi:hypothetical protein